MSYHNDCFNVPCRRPGSFCGLQLLSGEQLERSVDSITQLLATGLVADAPLQDELGWMSKLMHADKVCPIPLGRRRSLTLKLHQGLRADATSLSSSRRLLHVADDLSLWQRTCGRVRPLVALSQCALLLMLHCLCAPGTAG
jgi:hypothetical protein